MRPSQRVIASFERAAPDVQLIERFDRANAGRCDENF
jgi:hypothetical protein